MVLVGLALATMAGLQIAYLTLRGEVKPFTGLLFVPEADSLILYPALMDEPKWSIQTQIVQFTNNSQNKQKTLDNDVRFFLWTKNEPKKSRQLIVDDRSKLLGSGYSKNQLTKILIHGFLGDSENEFVTQTRNAYLSMGDYNVIGVDWEDLAKWPYENAADNTRTVGEKVAKLVDFLVSEDTPIDNIHLLGYSLGAHAAGWAGASTLERLPRITAFDPAFPCFEGPRVFQISPRCRSTNKRRLSKNDAKFVDVIHTNARNGKKKALGFATPLGHADFYPNGGTYQPGCIGDKITKIICNHSRSWKLFTESITNPTAFPASPCPSYKDFLQGRCEDCSGHNPNCVKMGKEVKRTASGTYYLRTRATRPYSLN